ncbi:CHAD domain-containing protein [Aphanothece sacrum]|uniref:CHAD protein n=1 Tax=Aphanothece sacrum FPU1 TaxID=1920663 RepID=A0A401IGI7_APHSA|nr:CHAD domain-containing protein [Aphanothece sacrum]GBF80402.1 CHAD protein [Aphanothece sacrum FPU1]GBF84891.1 hypothetical protein AsFPU3_1946 [Aphanothece sacrum FPU3]
MKHHLDHEPQTFGDWAYLGIAKHFDKIIKHEIEVIVDKDPEELHQMRVGMRRLRSTIVGFLPALNLPKYAQEKRVGKVAKILGELRDLDVLGDSLKNQYQPNLPKDEQKHLQEVINDLDKQRKKTFKKVKELLISEKYLDLKQSFTDWLNEPQYQPISEISIETVLPDLLLPEVSRLLVHPGWLIGVKFSQGETYFPDGLSQKEVETLLDNEDLILHNLRKEAKRCRYNMELFTQFYGDSYQQYLEDVKMIQTVLGEIQDSFVLVNFLAEVFKEDITQTMPNLSNKIGANRYKNWQEWEQLQRKFIKSKFRKDFHFTILKPELINSEVKN